MSTAKKYPSSSYHIFERLNNGGRRLYPQEIRSCTFYGEFKKLLNGLNKNQEWRNVLGKNDTRLKDEEIIKWLLDQPD